MEAELEKMIDRIKAVGYIFTSIASEGKYYHYFAYKNNGISSAHMDITDIYPTTLNFPHFTISDEELNISTNLRVWTPENKNMSRQKFIKKVMEINGR